MTGPTDKSPVSFEVSIARLPARGMPVRIKANEAECRALASMHGLEQVRAFTADLLVSKWKKDGIVVTGTLQASIVQQCIVTLEPVEAVIDVPVEVTLVPENSKLAHLPDNQGEILVDVEGPDAPETFTGNTIDAGAIAEEIFELAIDPYPRKSDAHLSGSVEADKDERPNPFAKLAALRTNKGN